MTQALLSTTRSEDAILNTNEYNFWWRHPRTLYDYLLHDLPPRGHFVTMTWSTKCASGATNTTFSLCLVFLFTSFFSSLFLCEPRGFSFWPFFLPPSMFSVLISNSFRSTPISFLRPLAVHFVKFRVVILPVLKFFFALTDHVFLFTPFGPSWSYSVFIPQCYLLFGTL